MFSSIIDNINHLIFPTSFSQIKEKLLKGENINLEIKGYIVSHTKIENQKYFNLTIQIGKQNSNDFIYYHDEKQNFNDFNYFEEEENTLKDGNEIQFNLNKIKFTSVNNKCYLEIVEPKIKSSKKTLEKNIQLFNFDIFQFVNNYNEIVFNNKTEVFFSIILKVKHIEESDQCKYQFYDLNDEYVPVNYLGIKNEIEGQKIYIFNSFKYMKDLNNYEQLTPIKYSTVIPIDNNNIIYNKDFVVNKNERITSFFGEIKSFILEKNKIEVTDKNQNILSIQLNNRLFTKIFLGCQCKFQCFLENLQEPNSFKYTNFSDIISYEKTTIFLQFIGTKRDYDHILIDNKIYELNNKNEIECQIYFESNSNKNIVNKTIQLKSKKNNIEISYIMEINRGKKNIGNLYLGKDGKFCYQIYTQAKNESKLKKEFNLIIDGTNFQFKNYETYENKLKNRITFINIPNDLQNVNNKNSESNIKDSNNSIKILKLINDTENEYKFKLLLEKEQKGEINYTESSLINSFYDQYFTNIYKLEKDSKIIKLKENVYHKLFYEEIEIKKFEKYIKKGFDNYIFNDNEKDYQFIKKICFAYLFNAKKESDFTSFLFNYKRNILNMTDLDFIERIRILIAITNEYSGLKKPSYISLSLIGDNNYDNSVNEAHKILLEILDGLKEDCSLFHAIHQFNSIIRMEMISNENMYSGSILTLNDIKLEIYKNLNRFYLISYEDNQMYGAIYKNSKVTILYYDEITNSLFKDKSPSKDEKKRISAAILMILFHELGGHLKTHINNKLDSPRTIFSPNLNLITLNLKKNDSGFLLEFLLVGGSIEVSKFIYSERSEELLNKNLYLGGNFEELTNILTSIDSKTIEKEDINATADLIKFKKKILSEKDLEKFNYEKLNYQQLTKLFADMDEAALKEHQEAYKYYISKFFGNPDKKC